MVLDRLWPGAPWVCGKDCLSPARTSMCTQLVGFYPLSGQLIATLQPPSNSSDIHKPGLGSCTFIASHIFFYSEFYSRIKTAFRKKRNWDLLNTGKWAKNDCIAVGHKTSLDILTDRIYPKMGNLFPKPLREGSILVFSTGILPQECFLVCKRSELVYKWYLSLISLYDTSSFYLISFQ